MAARDVKLKVEETDVHMTDSGVKPMSLKRSPSLSVPPTPSSKDGEMSSKPSPSPTPTLEILNKLSLSASNSPSKRETRSRTSSATPTPTPTGKSNRNVKSGPQLIGDLPRAEKDAMKTFVELEENHYQYSTLGRSREALESMTCDCTFVPGRDDPETACGHDSDCINRLTQVECLEDDCRCRSHCKNQRMQRREYANIEIVLTEKKGYGLRAGSDIHKDAFIYEYIGDVVSQPSFVKRMREYAEEGIRHFYFMMLQKDEFIDATKRGGIGRFANHSCNPNCFVAKWTVGDRVRMGIYAKRNIRKDEELTFNYNVDRYGHDAQPCYCGEPNCVGLLGGKTQTDVAAMDDLYLDALGISEEVEMYGLKGNKKKKGKKLDEDYVPILKPLVEKDIPKVVQAIRQTQSRKVLLKLLSRIKMTDDQPALRQLMRLRGYSLMCNILEDYLSDVEICTIIMDSLSTWPLLQRNKVEDSKIEEPITTLTEHENENVSALAKKLLEHWASLETGYRIPKRLKGEGAESSTPTISEVITFEEEPTYKKVRQESMDDVIVKESGSAVVMRWKHLPKQKRRRETPRYVMQKEEPKQEAEPRQKYWWELLNVDPEKVKEEMKQKSEEQKALLNETTATTYYAYKYERDNPNLVIADAQRRAEERRREEERRKHEEERIAVEKEQREKEKAERKLRRAKEKQEAKEREREKKQNMTYEEKEALKEKRLQKLIGQVVVKCLSKHKDQLDHDTFKKKAKELTCIIAEKEKRSQSYQAGKLDALSEEKIIKIKKFSKEYIAKLLRRMASQSRPESTPSGSNEPSGSGSGSKSRDAEQDHDEPMMSVEDALDLGPEDNDNDDMDSIEGDDEDDSEEKSGDPSPASDLTARTGPGPSVTIIGRDVDVTIADRLSMNSGLGLGLGGGMIVDADGDIKMRGRGKVGGSQDSPPTSPSKRHRWDQPPESKALLERIYGAD